ncbi:MAG: GNAT family N-acetyltransferase [Chloroflexi bacterium]|nr:GNAT family N-acetyltransferase [Chloroflexota bacterium]
MTGQSSTFQSAESSPAPSLVRASEYSFKDLARIYSETRVDYIVPMPMNARRMEEYVRHYDVQLESSFVALNSADEEMGIGMLGLRGTRSWITRLGVMPNQRGHRVGQFLVDKLIQTAREQGAEQMQLEVIEGNEPGHRLFVKQGFDEVRRLLVIRRPPAEISDSLVFESKLLEPDAVREKLASRASGASWIEENASLLNIGRLSGLQVNLPSGQSGWVAFYETAFQLSHLVLGSDNAQVALALLQAVHKRFPLQDTKVENLPVTSPLWSVFQRVGYVETFRRIEMHLAL